MADDEEVAVASEENDDDSSSSGGVLSGVVKILVFVVGFLVFIILSVVISVVVNRIINRNNVGLGGGNVLVSDSNIAYTAKTAPYTYYEGVGELRTRTSDFSPRSLTIDIQLGYDATTYEGLAEELNQRNPKLIDMLRNYFSSKTAAEILQEEDRIKEEIKAMINALLINGRIEEIVFLQKQVLEF